MVTNQNSIFSVMTYLFFTAQCRTALGMEEGRIPDTAISASSSYEVKSVGPQNARFDILLSRNLFL